MCASNSTCSKHCSSRFLLITSILKSWEWKCPQRSFLLFSLKKMFTSVSRGRERSGLFLSQICNDDLHMYSSSLLDWFMFSKSFTIWYETKHTYMYSSAINLNIYWLYIHNILSVNNLMNNFRMRRSSIKHTWTLYSRRFGSFYSSLVSFLHSKFRIFTMPDY